VQNRWTHEAASLAPLEQLVHMSRLLGAEESLVLLGGGNTSLKVLETDFRGRETHVLRIKGSGSDLKTIRPDQFAGVRMEDVLPLFDRDAMTDEEMVEWLARTLMDPASPRPSIETLLHAFIPQAAVAHTHSDAIVALTDNANGHQALRECFGEDVLPIPYVRPGFALSKHVGRVARQNPGLRAVVLVNHGLVTWGDSAEEAYRLHIELVTRAEEHLAAHRGPSSAQPVPAAAHRSRRLVAAQIAPVLRGAIARLGGGSPPERCILLLDESPEATAFASRSDALRVTRAGPATPDHLLHTRRMPLVLPGLEPGSEPEWTARIQAAAEAWAREYRAYFARHASGERLLSHAPRVILAPGIGMWTAGKDARSAQIAGDIYRHTIRVIQDAEVLGPFSSLSDRDCFDVEYWPLELYKLTLAPPEKEMARRAVLVTGAAGAIGSAIAWRLAREGAHVALTDLDGERCAAIAREIAAACGTGTAIGLAMDVACEDSVRRGFREAVLAFGGLDVVVSNAGIAHSARLDELDLEDWKRSLDVNATGHFLVAREAIRILRAQGIGGSLVFNVTKNALAAGAEFGAYSAAKAAELQLARVAAIENGAAGIRVNMVNPDAVFSAGLWSPEMKARRAHAQGIPVDQVEEHYRQRNLLKARVEAEDVAEAVLWLASDRSSKTTGCIVPVDGGLREAFPR